MASRSTFVVLDAEAPRKAVHQDIHNTAVQLAAQAAQNTPVVTGKMQAGWSVEDGDDPGTSVVSNDVLYAHYVEYGTRYMRAEAPLGRAIASGRNR